MLICQVFPKENPANMGLSIKTEMGSGTRHSGIELLRLLSMVFILALHINFFAFGQPTSTSFESDFLGCSLRFFWESLTIVGVNTFVLISGWFGIRPKTKSVLALLFQCAFFCCALYMAGWVFGVDFSRREALRNLFLLGKANWFIKSYLLLYILSPALESFVASASRRTFKALLLSFFVFQSIYGWLYPVAVYFSNGYSTISFVGLYLLARYVHLFRPRFATLPKWEDLGVFLCLTAITMLLGTLGTFGILPQRISVFAYCSPFVIAGALYLFLFFSKWDISSRLVNETARSSYAIYLFHAHPCVTHTLLVPTAANILQMRPMAHFVLLPLLLLAFALSAIALDRVRIIVWQRLSGFIPIQQSAVRIQSCGEDPRMDSEESKDGAV